MRVEFDRLDAAEKRAIFQPQSRSKRVMIFGDDRWPAWLRYRNRRDERPRRRTEQPPLRMQGPGRIRETLPPFDPEAQIRWREDEAQRARMIAIEHNRGKDVEFLDDMRHRAKPLARGGECHFQISGAR